MMTNATNRFTPSVTHRKLDTETIVDGLAFPEGPIAMADGSVLLVEIRAERLTRVRPDGSTECVARIPGGPNGAEIGPDGKVYVCNNGGFSWSAIPGFGEFPVGTPESYKSGSIERVDLATGHVERLYDVTPDGPLGGPNDLAFDRRGGFWFTDPGKAGRRDTGNGTVWYAKADGSQIRKVITHLASPNGIALSADGRRLYVVEALTARLFVWDVTAPGEVDREAFPSHNGGRFVGNAPGYVRFDSMALDSAENACVATVYDGSGITVFSPDGRSIVSYGLEDPVVTNICFGGPECRTAYITCAATGTLVSAAWDVPGLSMPYGGGAGV